MSTVRWWGYISKLYQRRKIGFDQTMWWKRERLWWKNMHMCQEKWFLKSVPEKYFCLQSHQNFIVRQIFKFLFLISRIKKSFLQAKLIFWTIFQLSESNSFSAAWFWSLLQERTYVYLSNFFSSIESLLWSWISEWNVNCYCGLEEYCKIFNVTVIRGKISDFTR